MNVAGKRALMTAVAITAAGSLMLPSLAACSSTTAPSATTSTTQPSNGSPSTPTTSVPSSTTTTTVPATALSSAEAAISSFWTSLDSLSAEPNSDLAALAKVARDPAFQTWQQLIVQRRVKSLRQIGATKVATAVATRTGASTFEVEACIDVSGTDLVDSKGKSVVPADRSPRIRYQYSVVQGSDSKFYVTRDKASGSC